MAEITNEVDNQQLNFVESYKTTKAEDGALDKECCKVNLPFEVKEGEEYFIEDVGSVAKKPFFSFVKRAFDITVSFFALIIFSLLFLIVSIGIKCSSKGPAFYKQERLGLNGKKYNIIKFRTMVLDAEKDGARWSEGDDDERIFKFGRFLRKTHLDELPQLWCVFVGTMTFIGPRPERECFYNEFEKYIHGFKQRLLVKPGITGLAQVNGGYYLKPQEKVLYDVEYIKKRSIWLDIKILFKTVGVVFSRKDVK